MAHPEGTCSNSLWATLDEWEYILKHTSLAWQVPANAVNVINTANQIGKPASSTQRVDINVSHHRASIVRKRKSAAEEEYSSEAGNG